MLIEFSELNIKLLIPLIFPICKIIELYVQKLYLNEDNDDNRYFISFRYFSSYIFAIIFLLIVQYRSKSKKNIIFSEELIKEREEIYQYFSKERISEVELTSKIIDKRRKLKSGIFLTILCVIGLLSDIYKIIFNEYEYDEVQHSLGVFLYIGFFILLSYLILKQKLYKHHFISAGVTGFVLLILFFILISIDDNKKKINFFGCFLYYFFFALLFSLYDILGKKYMNDFNHIPYFIMSIIGPINSFLLLIFDIYAYFYYRDISGIIIGFQKNINNALNLFGFLLALILEFFANLGIWLTIYHFTPCHFFISEYMKELYNVFYRMERLDVKVIPISIAYLINMFFILVFNEVIILNFWNLDYNTKKRIQQRTKLEHSNAITIDENYKASLNVDSDDEED